MSNFKVKLIQLDNYLNEVNYNEGNIDSYELTGSGLGGFNVKKKAKSTTPKRQLQ